MHHTFPPILFPCVPVPGLNKARDDTTLLEAGQPSAAVVYIIKASWAPSVSFLHEEMIFVSSFFNFFFFWAENLWLIAIKPEGNQTYFNVNFALAALGNGL